MKIFIKIVTFMNEKCCWSIAVKVGKKLYVVQLSLSKYKQFSSNINGKVIEILIKMVL